MVCRFIGSYYLNQWWNIVNWALREKLQWNLNRNLYIFIQANAFENVVWKMTSILSRVNVLSYVNATFCLSLICVSDWCAYDDVIKSKLFPRYWPFVPSPVNSSHKGPIKRTLMFLYCVSPLVIQQTVGWLVIWDYTIFMWRHRNGLLHIGNTIQKCCIYACVRTPMSMVFFFENM